MDPKKILPAGLLLLTVATLVVSDIMTYSLGEDTRMLLGQITIGAAGGLGLALRGSPNK